VNDRSAILLGALAGAVLGSAAGFLFLTERGRQIREDLEPKLAEFVNEFQRLKLTADRARQGARSAWQGSDRPFDPARGDRPAQPGEAH
jgi:gas vesicle protein